MENVKISNMMKCGTCSKEIEVGLKYCPECGAKNKKIFYKKNLFIYLTVFTIIVTLGIFTYYNYASPSVKSVYNEVVKLIDEEKYSEVNSYIESKYSKSSIFENLNQKKQEEVHELYKTYLEKVFYEKTGITFEKYLELQKEEKAKEDAKKNVYVSKIDCVQTSSSGKYLDVNTTIKNDSNQTIRYIKLNLYFKDENGNIVKSDWTNDNSLILPNASQVVRKMATWSGEWSHVTAEIDEIKFK